MKGQYFSNLLSNQQYEIRVVSNYNLNDGSGTLENSVLYSYQFSTPTSIVPTPQIINLKTEENRVSFNVVINDQFGVIDPDSLIAKIYVNGDLLRTVSLEEYKVDFQVSNLVSGFAFVYQDAITSTPYIIAYAFYFMMMSILYMSGDEKDFESIKLFKIN